MSKLLQTQSFMFVARHTHVILVKLEEMPTNSRLLLHREQMLHWLTLALIIVGRGSKIPCIFRRAGITNRLQVTTADTGLPRKRHMTTLGLYGVSSDGADRIG